MLIIFHLLLSNGLLCGLLLFTSYSKLLTQHGQGLLRQTVKISDDCEFDCLIVTWVFVWFTYLRRTFKSYSRESAEIIGRYKGSNFLDQIVWPSSVAVTIGWLVVVSVCNHLLLESDQNLLHSSFLVPLNEEWELAWFNNSVGLIHRWNVNFGLEADLRGYSWIVRSASNGQGVNSAVHFSVGRTNNSSIPISESLIVSLVKSIRDTLIWESSLFGLFKFFI